METNQEHFELLQKIVATYEIDAVQFYSKNDRVNSKYSGRFNFSFFARKIFEPFPTDKIGQMYIDLFAVSEAFMHASKRSYLIVQDVPQSKISVPELLMNMILAYQLPRHQTDNEIGSRRRSKKTIAPRVTLTQEQAESLVDYMLKIPLGSESNLWKQVKYVLNPTGGTKMINYFGESVEHMTETGFISYAALSFFMRDEKVRFSLKNPSTILQALYLGPLDASTVETFASNRSEPFRLQCQQTIKMAFEACQSVDRFEMYQPANIPQGHRDLVLFANFVRNVTTLRTAMIGTSSQSYQIPVSWAMAALKKFGHKRYEEDTWKDEQLYDLVWTILAQRPHLKKHVCDTLELKFQDKNAAAYWRRMQPQQMSKTHIRNIRVSNLSPLYHSMDHLNFLPDMRTICMVTTESQILDFMKNLKQRVAKNGRITVGVDAEWSAYSFPSKATILQVGFRDSVYLIDLDSRQITAESYYEFMKTLFEDSNIIKIGFNFSEDLNQLRSKFRLCKSLYNAKRVVCIGKMISKIIEDIDQLENAEQVKIELLPFLQDPETKQENDDSTSADRSMDSKLDESIDESDKRKPSKAAKQSMFLNKGLSFICERILGKPLDKTEQCSVWDRRPLRSLQLRYAAMDAHCMLMLYDKCESLFFRMNLDINSYIDAQPPISVSLPLLTEYPL